MATALALPDSFPARDTAVLTAFCVVVATLVLQGLTLSPLIRFFRLDQTQTAHREVLSARAAIVGAALSTLRDETGPAAESLRTRLRLVEQACASENDAAGVTRLRELGLRVVTAEREALEKLRTDDKVGAETYLQLQEQIDWVELTFAADQDRNIEEI